MPSRPSSSTRCALWRPAACCPDPGATRRLIEAYIAGPAAGPDAAGRGAMRLPDSITGREREILALIAGSLTNAEIAARLVISPLTIKSHVLRILGKLAARDRTQLVVIAYESGLVIPGLVIPGQPGS